jgi:hypothetical protein
MSGRPTLTVLAGGLDHECRPDPASVKRTVTSEPASLLDPTAYPLIAVCAGCAEPIRAATYLADWRHV